MEREAFTTTFITDFESSLKVWIKLSWLKLQLNIPILFYCYHKINLLLRIVHSQWCRRRGCRGCKRTPKGVHLL